MNKLELKRNCYSNVSLEIKKMKLVKRVIGSRSLIVSNRVVRFLFFHIFLIHPRVKTPNLPRGHSDAKNFQNPF